MGIKKVECAIISGAPDEDYDFLKLALNSSDYIIAADSGYLKCKKIGVVPDMIIGDFDSSPYPDVKTEIVKLPTEKDDTDTFFCVKKAVELGFSKIKIFGAIGNRADHNYSNMLCLDYCRRNYVGCFISDRRNKLQLVDKEIVIDDKAYKYFSVFAFLGDVEGLTIDGAYYEVYNVSMKPYEQYAQSNCFKDSNPVRITVKKGVILLIQSND